MNQPEIFDPTASASPLRLSEAAVIRLRELYGKQQPGEQFRVYITGGGCSGFQYGFKFDREALEDDLAIHQDGIDFVVDSLSLQYLTGAEIDFENNLMGARFRVQNPNSSTTCSCGSSFSV